MIQHARMWLNNEDWSDCTIHVLTINGGRSSPFVQADVATVGISIHLPAGRSLPNIGDVIDIGGWLVGATHYASLFSGNVTDVAFEPGAGPDGTNIVSLTAADRYRTLDGLPVGGEPWTPEHWRVRISKIWDEAAAELGNPSWMDSEIYDYYLYGETTDPPAPFVNAQLSTREMSSAPALELLNEYFAPNGHAVYFVPGSAFYSFTVSPPWGGSTGHVNLFNLVPTAGDRVIPASLILTAPRYWTNLGNVAHKVVVRGRNYQDESPGEWSAEGGDPQRYGYKTKSIASEIHSNYEGYPDMGKDDPQELADLWLPRVQWPAYMCEIILRFGPTSLMSQGVWDAIVHGGPAQCGRVAHIERLSGSTSPASRPDLFEWVIEGSEYILTENGWDIKLNLSPTSAYTGQAPLLPGTGGSEWVDIVIGFTSWNDLVTQNATWQDVVSYEPA